MIRLGHAKNIRLEIEVFAGEELSGAAESRGDFVCNEESAVARAEIANAAHEPDVRDDRAEVTNDWLHDKRGNVALL